MASFLTGLKGFFDALLALVQDRDILQWFRKTTLVAFVVALLVLLFLSLSGAFLIASLGGHWVADVGAFLWVILVVYFSGTLCMLVMSLVVGLWGQEEVLMRSLLKNPALRFVPMRWSDLRGEIYAACLSAVVTLLCWPLIFVVPLIPLAVLLMSWAFGREAYKATLRVFRQSSLEIKESSLAPSWSYFVGLGLGPVLLSFVPVVGWMMWPVLLLASLKATLRGQRLL